MHCGCGMYIGRGQCSVSGLEPNMVIDGGNHCSRHHILLSKDTLTRAFERYRETRAKRGIWKFIKSTQSSYEAKEAIVKDENVAPSLPAEMAASRWGIIVIAPDKPSN